MASWVYETIIEEAKKYETLAMFRKGSSGAYQGARRLGILDDVRKVCPSTVAKHINWDVDSVLEAASHFSTLKEFREGNTPAYTAACDLDILKLVKEICPTTIAERTNWTLDMVLSIADEYTTLKEFKRENQAAYKWATENNYHNQLREVLECRKPSGYWNKHTVLLELSDYETLSDFRKNNQAAYKAARDLGMLDIVRENLECAQVQNGYWTYEKIAEEALNYATRTEFSNAKSHVYNYACKTGILDDVCSHMRRVGDLYNRCVYTIIDPNNSDIYIGLTCDFEKRDHSRDREAVASLRERGVYSQYSDYLDAYEAIELERSLIAYYTNHQEWNCINIHSGGGLGSMKL